MTGHFDAPDAAMMALAVESADEARLVSPPNPWVGAVVVGRSGSIHRGSTRAPGQAHAEIVALERAGDDARGGTLYCTLEPCHHHGRTPPCTGAIVDAGIARVVVAIEDADERVRGRGLDALRAAGLDVLVGVSSARVTEQLRPYLHHRRTGRPWCVLKMACTADGRVAAADGSSRWITGDEIRRRAHRMRAESDAILVGAGTVRRDDPELTTRDVDGPSPRRVVLGRAEPGARVHPCLEWNGEPEALLDQLGADGVVQLLVEGGPRVARTLHERGLIDRYVLHVAPALAAGSAAPGIFAGDGPATIADLWRGRFVSAERFGDDIELVLEGRNAA